MAIWDLYTRALGVPECSNYTRNILQRSLGLYSRDRELSADSLEKPTKIAEEASEIFQINGSHVKLAYAQDGNRMNAIGTARGNAQGFKLIALGKVYDVKNSHQ